MDLGEDGGQAVLHPLDEIQLPQGLGPVERPRDHALHVIDQLAVPSRGGQGGPPHVKAKVERPVVHPDGAGRRPVRAVIQLNALIPRKAPLFRTIDVMPAQRPSSNRISAGSRPVFPG